MKTTFSGRCGPLEGPGEQIPTSAGPPESVDSLIFWTLNANSWGSVQKLIEQGQFDQAHVLCIQEPHLFSESSITSAVQWMLSRGWLATFQPALLLESGGSTGGTAVAVRDGLDAGVNPVAYEFPVNLQHRALAVQLEIADVVPFVFVSAYFQDKIGLQADNLDLLSQFPLLQEASGRPVLVGADFDIQPKTIQNTDFQERAAMQVIAPSQATHFKGKPATVFDYFLGSTCLPDFAFGH